MNLKPLLILPPLLLGIAGYMWMNTAGEMPTAPREEARLAVRVMTVTRAPVDVTATGYGRVAAERSWTAVSQVDGRVVDTVRDLAVGTLVDENTVLMQIDRTDYDLAIQKSTANIASAEAALAELDRKEANSQRLLALEQRILSVAEAEFERVQELVERGTSTAAARDTAQKTLLAQENAVTALINTLDLYPAQRASAEATLAVRKAELAEAERGLANTTITAPFRGRVADVSVEIGQFVRTGEQLLSVDAIDAAEIVASFQPQAFGAVTQAAVGRNLRTMAEIDASRIVEYLIDAGVTASVRLDIPEFDTVRSAELVRFRGTIDSETGTIGMAVRVDDPLTVSGPRRSPPLSIGSFVSVTLTTRPPEGAIAIPRAAVHQTDLGAPFVYVADADDRLTIKPIVPGPVTGDRILIRDGLIEGDRLILSDPRPPIVGMALTPVLVDTES